MNENEISIAWLLFRKIEIRTKFRFIERGNFNKYFFWPFMNLLLRILSSNIHNKLKSSRSANHRDETKQKICISMPSRRDMQTYVVMFSVSSFFFVLCFWGHSMLSFVNLIRRRSFFVITANHYSVGRLNKQANKIINGEKEKSQESRRNKTEAN